MKTNTGLMLTFAVLSSGCIGNPQTTLSYTTTNCAPLQTAAAAVTMKDKLVVDASGTAKYVTANDGVARALIPTQTLAVSKSASAISETVYPADTLPSCVMLDQQGLESPVKDQGALGTCTIFAAVGTIEAEYLNEYGTLLDLSEQYVINMMNETRPPDWAGGGDGEKLAIASFYGLPFETDWPYINSSQTWQTLVTTSLNTSPSTSYDDVEAQMWSSTTSLYRDIANYSTLIYPTTAVLRDAAYGPIPGDITTITNDGTDTSPFESVLAQGHSIAFLTVVGRWLTDPTTGIIGYDPNGTDTGGHSIVLVGYDHTRQVFRIKNSWGSSWNGNGFAEITYELFLKTAADVNYITAVKDPGAPKAGTGIWRGFWAVPGSNGAGSSVAMINHGYSPVGTTAADPNAVDIYAQDGTVNSYVNFVSGDVNSITFSSTQDIFTLTISADGLSATYTDATNGTTATWRRCNPDGGTVNLNPTTYPAALQDTFVLPTCGS